MKTVLLAGGLGTRLAEETGDRPKPMVEVGDRPLVWHIMRHYHHFGFREFVLALGYKSEVIKRYFLEYGRLAGSLSLELATGRVEQHDGPCEDWAIHLIDTGRDTNTGGRLRRLHRWLGTQTFMLTYGDGVSDIDLRALVRFHRRCRCMATVTAVRPPARFGGLDFDGNLVSRFIEKPQIGEGWINGGFMVFEPAIFRYLDGDDCNLERHVLTRLAAHGQLAAYRHEGFWQCVDTLRDKRLLESLWQDGQMPGQLNGQALRRVAA